MPPQSNNSGKGGGKSTITAGPPKIVPKVGKNSATTKPPAIDKLLIPAIVVAVAIVAYQFLQGITAEIKRVNVEDELELRQVFFGNEEGIASTFIVLCHDESSKVPISSVFSDAYKDGTVPGEFRIMDCNHILPDTGKTIFERFQFDPKVRPTIFIAGAKIDGEPQQIPNKHLKTGKMLVKVLKNKLEPRAAKIETTQDLRTKCLDKEICALLLKGSKKAPGYLKDAMNKLLIEFPRVTFAAIDATVLYAKNLEEYLPELASEQPRFVVFKKVSGSADPKGQRLITSIAPLSTNGVSYGLMSNLVASVVSGTAELQKIPALPTIVTRTKKVVQDDKAKRERKANRQPSQQQQQQSQQNPPPSSQTNDGSRDGRRAERERRRSEHNKIHNVKPKTPEEMAEMERQRRLRMEEEAKKWNMAPEDLPPEGDTIFHDEDNTNINYDDEEEASSSTGETTIHDSNGDEDDEDVMDLD